MKLTELPPEIGNLTGLERLYVQANELTALPEEITQLQNLQILNIGDNKLTELPENIGNLKSLVKIIAKGNDFSDAEKERIQNALPDVEIVF